MRGEAWHLLLRPNAHCMPDVVMTQGIPIQQAIDAALDQIALLPLVSGRRVAVKPNDTWASKDDTTGITQPDTLRAVLRAEASSRQRLGWIDFHTGLGPRGHGEKIYSGRDHPADVARAKAWWGDDVTSFFDGSSTSAHVTGVISAAAYDECPRTEMTGMALEYGTYSLEHTLQTLRAEHWLHNHPEAPARQREEIKRALRDTFYIDADDWKTIVYEQAKEACLEAVAALAATSVHT